ncbi:MAG: class I SAM-dependent methyltransferase, partial [Ferrovibrio sp.]
HDHSVSPDSRGQDETAVRSMYERAPYPGLGAGLKNPDLYLKPIESDLSRRETVRFLDAGCGTGHYLVGVAKHYPEWHCHGIDLSANSLSVAGELAKKHNVTVTLTRGSYLDPLPYDEKFDVIAAIGTVHHAADPVAALRNLSSALKDDGYLLLHMYGLRLDREKFDIKEMLSIFQPDLTRVDERFQLYSALIRHRKRSWIKYLLQTPPIVVYGAWKAYVKNALRRYRGEVWSPAFTAQYDEPTAPWVDHFCHPCERAYEVPEIVELLEAAGFRAHKVLGQGREYPNLIPEEWRPAYDRLPETAKWRLSELLAFGGASFRLILKKA